MAVTDLPTPVVARPAGGAVDLAALRAALAAGVDGEVRFDAGSRAAYATDGSNYRQPPLAVVVPRTVAAGVAAVAACRRFGAPLLSRGGGTSLAGQTTNAAVVIDWTKYCHRLVSVDPVGRRCVVEPGIVLDVLNGRLAEHGLMFGPQPSTHVSCTIGGMIGNNSCGATAQAYGKTVDNVARLEVLTYDGLRMWVGPTSDAEYQEILRTGGRRAEIHRQLRALRDAHLAEIRTGYPRIPRRVSGYNLDSLLPERGFDVAGALVGSEGTLVTVLHAELQLVPVPPHRALAVLGYPDVVTAARAVPRLLPHRPHRLEGLDDKLIELERHEHLHPEALAALPPGAGWLMVEFTGDSQQEADRRAQELLDDVEGHPHPPTAKYLDDPAREDALWEVREGGLGATAHPPQHNTWEGWEDAAVPPDRLGDYLRDFTALLDRYGYAELSALYGHFGQGCVHTRTPFELRTAEGVAAFRAFLIDAAHLVTRYGGSLSGEHGDGQSRGELLPIMFGPELVRAFGELKAIFDPGDRMNPGKVVAPYRVDENLRLGTGYSLGSPETYFRYPHDNGSFRHAVLRCVGVGKCRNHGGSGVMCPSYQVTGEEEHSTRGRARLLFEMLRGEVIHDGWRSAAVRDALDLCLACKGCKSDCPVGVDMATYKAEFLAHHYARRLRPAAHYLMGWLPALARLASVAPGAVNAATHLPGLSALLKRAAGVAREREVPRFAGQRFADWYRDRGPAGGGPRGTVLLWPDTFTNNLHPQVGRAAVAVLEAAGFRVRVPERTLCCGLTWISTGQLRTAKRVLRRTVAALRDDIRAGTPVVGLEPSCTAVFRSDAPELLPDDEDVHRLASQTRTLAELIAERARDWQPPPVDRHALVQTHCHQHAVLGFDAEQGLLRRAGIDATVLDSGCCGLAGNFGFERGHYRVSMDCAERVLLPAVRAAGPGDLILADGFSCRTQIEQARTGHRPVHLAEALAAALPADRVPPVGRSG